MLVLLLNIAFMLAAIGVFIWGIITVAEDTALGTVLTIVGAVYFSIIGPVFFAGLKVRLSASLWQELAAWAEDDFRSINGQIEYLLTECVRQGKNQKELNE